MTSSSLSSSALSWTMRRLVGDLYQSATLFFRIAIAQVCSEASPRRLPCCSITAIRVS